MFNDTIDLQFLDESHRDFYNKTLWDLEGAEGPFTRPAVYLLSASDILRAHFWEVYDNHCHTIKPDCWLAPWNTPETRLLIALAAEITGSLSEKETLAPAIRDALSWTGRINALMGLSSDFMEGPLI